MRHPQLLAMLLVPKVMPAAAIWPMKYETLNQRGEDGSFLGVSEFADQGRAGDDTGRDAESEYDSCGNVHAS